MWKISQLPLTYALFGIGAIALIVVYRRKVA